MTIFEILEEYRFSLPDRNNDKTYLEIFIDEMNLYTSLLEKLQDFDIHQEKKRTVSSKYIFEQAMRIAKDIVKILGLYSQGKPFEAYLQLKEMIENPETNLKIHSILGEVNFYRVRNGNTNSNFSKEDLFHIPFELTRKVSNQRYSISGFPSLYLSDSIYTCWEEMRRPDIDNLYCSRFELRKFISLLEIPNPQEEINRYVSENKIIEGVIGNGLDSLLINWPLYFACSIKVKYPHEPYKVEYVLPQLLLQYVRSNIKIDGIKYFSTNIDYDNDNIKGTFNNYVFPIKTFDEKGYCNELKKMFSITEPESKKLNDISSATITLLYKHDNSESFAVEEIEIINGKSIPYNNTVFGALEIGLESSNNDFIE